LPRFTGHRAEVVRQRFVRDLELMVIDAAFPPAVTRRPARQLTTGGRLA
jgi:hypothetical protein